MRSRTRLACVAVSLVLASCDSEPVPDLPDLPRYEVVSTVSERVDPVAGATLTLGGATLQIPPGALGAPAEIALWETTLPVEGEADGPGSAGQDLLWDHGFLVVSDREVEITGPLYLDLPVEETRLPAGASLGDANVSAFSGGYLHPQGPAASSDGSAIRAPITVARLPEGPPEGAAPRGAGVPFLSLTAGLANAPPLLLAGALLGSFLQPIVATVSQETGYQWVITDNFVVYYRDGVADADAAEIGAELERARALYVDGLGYSLPNLGSFFTRYPVFIADLSYHHLFPGSSPDGATWAGSGVWGGSSYINAQLLQPERVGTAMHEYFHALQWGVMTRIAPNSVAKALDEEGQWLIEGSATAMAGRLTFGGGTVAARDATLRDTVRAGVSVYDPRGQAPAPDVTQDFFVFLENQLGDPNFYREMLAQVRDDLPTSTIEPSVVAVDDVLLARSGDESGLSAAWRAFVRDLLWDNPTAYPTPESATIVRAVRGDGTVGSQRHPVPPLSFLIQPYTIQELSTDSPDDEQPRDLVVRLSATGDSVVQLDVRVAVVGQAPLEIPLTLSGEASEVVLSGVRARERVDVVLTVTNPYLGVDDGVSVTIETQLDDRGDAPLLSYPRTLPVPADCPESITVPERLAAAGGVIWPAGTWSLSPREENQARMANNSMGAYYWQLCGYSASDGGGGGITFSRFFQPFDVTLYLPGHPYLITRGMTEMCDVGGMHDPFAVISDTHQVIVQRWTPPPECTDENTCAWHAAVEVVMRGLAADLESVAVPCP